MAIAHRRHYGQDEVKTVNVEGTDAFISCLILDLLVDGALVHGAVKVRPFDEHPGALTLGHGLPTFIYAAVASSKSDPNTSHHVQPEQQLNHIGEHENNLIALVGVLPRAAVGDLSVP